MYGESAHVIFNKTQFSQDCMEQLLKASSSWKYFFNAIGTALPGMPVMVNILKLFYNKYKNIIFSVYVIFLGNSRAFVKHKG